MSHAQIKPDSLFERKIFFGKWHTILLSVRMYCFIDMYRSVFSYKYYVKTIIPKMVWTYENCSKGSLW